MMKALPFFLFASMALAAGTQEEHPLGEAYIRAAQQGDRATMIQCLQQGVAVNYQVPIGDSALMCAAHHQHTELVQFLLYLCADVNLQTDFGSTALMMAAGIGNMKIVKILIEAGADPTLKNGIQEDAVALAERNHHQEVANYIRQAQQNHLQLSKKNP